MQPFEKVVHGELQNSSRPATLRCQHECGAKYLRTLTVPSLYLLRHSHIRDAFAGPNGCAFGSTELHYLHCYLSDRRWWVLSGAQ